MRVFISCKSKLIQSSVYSFLKSYSVPNQSDAEFVVTDYMMESSLPLFIISNSDEMSSLSKPFSRSDLLLAVEEFYGRLEKKEKFKEEHFETLSLEKKIEALTKEYTTKLLHLMKNEK